MTWNLFVDDERFPKDVTWAPTKIQQKYRDEEWVICRNDFEVYHEISKRNEFPVFVSWDHDLGDGVPTGYDIVKELVDRDISQNSWVSIPKNFQYYVHSKNPVGKKNIESYLDNYLRVRDA